jgi:hypothetical protein
MRKDSGTGSGEPKALPGDRAPVLPIKPWQPSPMKTGLRNHPVGKKVSVVVRQRARELKESSPDSRGSQ